MSQGFGFASFFCFAGVGFLGPSWVSSCSSRYLKQRFTEVQRGMAPGVNLATKSARTWPLIAVLDLNSKSYWPSTTAHLVTLPVKSPAATGTSKDAQSAPQSCGLGSSDSVFSKPSPGLMSISPRAGTWFLHLLGSYLHSISPFVFFHPLGLLLHLLRVLKLPSTGTILLQVLDYTELELLSSAFLSRPRRLRTSLSTKNLWPSLTN